MAAYSETLCDDICTKIEETSFGLRRICRLLGQPYDTVKDWIYKDQHGFAAKYELAKQLQQDRIADEILEIADDGSKDPETQTVQRDKLRIDARKWLLTNLGIRRSAAADKPKDPPDKPKDPPLKIGFVKIPSRELPNEENSGFQNTGVKRQTPSFHASSAERALAGNETSIQKLGSCTKEHKNPTVQSVSAVAASSTRPLERQLFSSEKMTHGHNKIQMAKSPAPQKKLRLLKENDNRQRKRSNDNPKTQCHLVKGNDPERVTCL